MQHTELLDTLYDIAFCYLDEYGWSVDDFSRLDYLSWLRMYPSFERYSETSKRLYVLYYITPFKDVTIALQGQARGK